MNKRDLATFRPRPLASTQRTTLAKRSTILGSTSNSVPTAMQMVLSSAKSTRLSSPSESNVFFSIDRFRMTKATGDSRFLFLNHSYRVINIIKIETVREQSLEENQTEFQTKSGKGNLRRQFYLTNKNQTKHEPVLLHHCVMTYRAESHALKN